MKKEKYVTLSTLKNIFTQKHINKNFPEPDFYHTTRLHCENFKVELKMFNLDSVLEAIARGVPTRLKLTEDYEHYKLIYKAIFTAKLDMKLPPKGIKENNKNKI
ncbi:MAG: hypothetical protein K2W92_02700 [Alphaproteobacteria bacterium]|nr:hypothetical protein [Alphaproteobacteria bacterium]